MLKSAASVLAVLTAAQIAQAQSQVDTTGGTSSNLPVAGVEDDRLVGVAQRERPGLDPEGIRLGSIILYPSVRNELEYDTNIFATAQNEEEDFNYIVTPRLELASDWGRHSFTANAQARNEFFFDNGSEDKTNITSFAELRLDVTSDAALFVSGFYDDLVEDRTSNAFDLTTEEPIDFTRAGGAARIVNRFNRVTVTGGVSYLDLDFDDAIIASTGTVSEQDIRDREVLEFEGRIDYQLSPDTSFFARGIYNDRDFGLELDTGAAFDRDSDGYEILGGFSFVLGNLFAGEISAGYIDQQFDDDPNLDDVSGFSYFAAFQWFPSERTTVTVSGGANIEDATVAGSSAFLSRSGSIVIDQEVREDLILQANFTYSNDDFEGIPRVDDRIIIGGGATYFINRFVNAFANVSYIDQDSSLDLNDFDRFTAVVGFTIGF